MTAIEWPRLIRDYVGLRVLTLVELRNGYVIIPAHTIANISRATGYNRITLTGEKCSCCGIKIHIGRVHKQCLKNLGRVD